MYGLFVFITIIIVVIALIVPNTTRPKVLESLKKLAKELGFSANALSQIDPSIKKFKAFNKAIGEVVDNRRLKIQAKEVSGGEHSYWVFNATWYCENVNKLKLELFQESFTNKVRKKFGMQDIEIFNEQFDDKFIIQCNHRYFPLQMFSNQFCNNLLKQNEQLGKIQIVQNTIRYTEHVCLDDKQKVKRLKSVVLAIRELAEMAENWSPTHKLNKSA